MRKNLWLLPALASALFLVYSLWAVVKEGPFGFVAVHTQSLWGVQVMIDLVCAATIAMLFAAPHAKKYGVKPLPWVVLTVLTGSIGLFAYAARIAFKWGNERTG